MIGRGRSVEPRWVWLEGEEHGAKVGVVGRGRGALREGGAEVGLVENQGGCGWDERVTQRMLGGSRLVCTACCSTQNIWTQTEEHKST